MKKIEAVFGGLVVFGLVASISFASQKIYDTKCASCHGKDGKGKAAMAKVFKVEPKALDLTSEEMLKKTDEDILKVIADGRKKMPAYSKQLKAEEQKSVLQYIRGLAPKK